MSQIYELIQLKKEGRIYIYIKLEGNKLINKSIKKIKVFDFFLVYVYEVENVDEIDDFLKYINQYFMFLRSY